MLNRRGFLASLGLIGLLPVIGRAEEGPQFDLYAAPKGLRILQGATGPDSTLISILAPRSSQLQIQITDSEAAVPFQSEIIDLKLGPFVIHQLYVSNLILNVKYLLRVQDLTLKNEHHRNFKALDWNNPQARIALMSCTSHRNDGAKVKMFRQLAGQKPDAIFFYGDLVYGNSAMDTFLGRPADPKDAFSVYVKSLMEFDLYQWSELVPIFSIPDDHDLAFNNAESNHPHKRIMYKMFRSFFPVDNRVNGIVQGPAAAFSMQAFGMQVFFMDGRYFRNTDAEILLGDEQMAWIQSELSQSDKPVLFISSQQFWDYGRLADSYEGDGFIEFKDFLKMVKSLNRPKFFLSGDVHYSQIQDLRYQGLNSYEISSSAMFSSTAGGFARRSPEDGQLEFYSSANFLMMDQIQSQPDKIQFNLTCISETSTRQFARSLEIRA